jgi:hypothetical protein
MWQKLTIISLLLLTSCGFRPLYMVESGNGIILDQLATIKFESKKGRQGQQLVNSLDNTFNPTGINLPKNYVLTVALVETHQAVAVQNNNEITRYNVVMDVTYTLRDINEYIPPAPKKPKHNNWDEKPNQIDESTTHAITSGKFKMAGSYDAVPSSNFATLVGKQNSVTNVINEISKELKRRIVISLQKL